MERKPSRDLKRQITFTETIKKNSTKKYEAKQAEFDQRINDLKVKLADALVAEENEAPAVTVVDTTITVHRAADPMATAKSIKHQLNNN